MSATRRLLALCLVALAAVGYATASQPPVVLEPADAPLWEGQGVTVAGIARDVRAGDDGSARFDLVADGFALAGRLPVEAGPLREGDSVTVQGRLARLNGVLTLLGTHVRPHEQAADAASLPALARDPHPWMGRPVAVEGVVERGHLRAEGHSVLLGTGEWPKSGHVAATALLDYHAACSCYRLDRVVPWSG